MRGKSITGTIAFVAVLLAGLLPIGPANADFYHKRIDGQFISLCPYSHRLPDDPIVHPNAPGASHLHDFFGNTTTNAFSQEHRLRNTSTTCRNVGDDSGYWTPSLLRDGVPVKPMFMKIYYRNPVGTTKATAKTTKPFPPGLRIVAGDSHAIAPQDPTIVRWSCGINSGMVVEINPPSCPTGFHLELKVVFPDCWDGVNLDSADHMSHMAYSTAGICPADHPVLLPQLTLDVRYPISGDPGNVALSSGGVYSGHADFFNAWNPEALKHATHCVDAQLFCGFPPPLPK